MSYVAAGFVSSDLIHDPVKKTYRGANAEVIASLHEFQRQINRFSATASFAPLKVDGVIGSKTAAATAKVSKLLATGYSESAVVQSATSGNLKYIATSADLLTSTFKSVADELNLAGSSVALKAGFPFLPVLAGIFGSWLLTVILSKKKRR